MDIVHRGGRSLGHSILLAAAVLLAAHPGSASAQSYPSKIITLLSNSTTGATEVAFRLTLDKVKENTGATILFEPRAGGQGAPALQALKRAAPDGYTVGLTFASPVTVNPFVTPELEIDPLKDFVPITKLMTLGVAVMVREDFPAKDMKELIAYAKARPGDLKFGYAGAGGMVWAALLEERTGMKFLQVPFKSSAESVLLMLGNHIDVTTAIVSTVTSQKGKLKALAFGGIKPSPQLPSVPLVSTTLPGVEFSTWFGILAPAGTPQPMISWLNRELARAVRDPGVVKIVETAGMDVVGDTQEEFAKSYRTEIETNRDIVKKYNIKG